MPRIVVIVGPTASGKTALSLGLVDAVRARGREAEVVSADSQQVYAGMDVGTAKATPEERARVRHHLIDVVRPDEAMTAARFVALADAALADIAARGRAAVVVGGTGLYVRALLHGLFEGPGADAALRARLEAQGAAALHARLGAVDPEAAARIDASDLRRLVRALEVFELTGTPISVHQRAHDIRRAPRRYPARVVGLDPERQELRSRIARRVEAMLAAGLVDEVRRLADAGFDLGLRAFDAIGYREARACLRGELDAGALAETIAAATRRFARRQLSWFRSEPDVVWHRGGREVDLDALAAWLTHDDDVL
jgi:tRNA dimethylallyltransferase